MRELIKKIKSYLEPVSTNVVVESYDTYEHRLIDIINDRNTGILTRLAAEDKLQKYKELHKDD